MRSTTSINSVKKGTLFIPDISGFTHFINHTEVNHSKHIIEELLGLILEEVGDSYKLSEIEGDAVLFYRFENKIDVKSISELAIRIFRQFHRHLLYYKRDRVCDCGACSSSERLSLKFIVHFGSFQEYVIGERVKLFGKEVILSHRLMKNQLDSHEYILISGLPEQEQINADFAYLDFQEASESYEDIGKVKIWYKTLGSFRENLDPIPPRSPLVIPTVPLTDCVAIKSDTVYLIRAVTEPEHRLRWMNHLKKIELKEHRINRIQTSHECLLDQGRVEIKLEDLIKTENEVRLIERAIMNFPSMEFFILYQFALTKNGINVSMGNALVPSENSKWISWIFPVFSKFLTRQNKKNMLRLKEYVENEMERS